jgi:hypothetical protein
LIQLMSKVASTVTSLAPLALTCRGKEGRGGGYRRERKRVLTETQSSTVKVSAAGTSSMRVEEQTKTPTLP